jgi:hypothetical protein
MKSYKIFILILITALLNSCTKLDDYHVSPNDPASVEMKNMLVAAEVSLAFNMGADIERFTSLINQHCKGSGIQTDAYYNYNFSESDFDNIWLGMYLNMANIKIIQDKAKTTNCKTYLGISQVLMAYSLGLMTDLFGDVPYKDAFYGQSNKKPKHDSQADVYNSIQNLLDSAIVNLSSIDEGLFTPGSDDIIYSGKATKWEKFAHGLKCKYYLHAVNKGGSAYLSMAVSEGQLSFTSNDDDAKVNFSTASTGNNPWYQYDNQRGDMDYADTNNFLMKFMLHNNDPRLDAYADPSSSINAADAPVTLLTSTEMLFIAAELTHRLGITNLAKNYYKQGIAASMANAGVSSSDIGVFLAKDTLGMGNDLEKIMTQKYVAMYLKAEPFVDFRRTGFPNLEPISGNNLPNRFIYPSNERALNINCNQNTTMFTPKMWWAN